ncbi:MAG: hypothetical protein ABI780_02600 [Ardenticatenales bacterium]
MFSIETNDRGGADRGLAGLDTGMANQPPIPLSGEALAFWKRHYSRLRIEKILTDADEESFALCAILWGKLYELADTKTGDANFRPMIQFDRLAKQYHAYAKQFGLLPRERKQAKMDAPTPANEKDEFGF